MKISNFDPNPNGSDGRLEIPTDIFTVINLEYIPHYSRFFYISHQRIRSGENSCHINLNWKTSKNIRNKEKPDPERTLFDENVTEMV